MSLFTAEDLIRAMARPTDRRIVDATPDVHRAYLRWLSTQAGHSTSSTSPDRSGWLVDVAELHSLRAPGNTSQLASDGQPSVEDIETLGGAWVDEEALAIAVYCTLTHPDNPRDAALLAVNHSGDSDSTGSIAGNIVGAIHGVAGAAAFTDRLELAHVITQVADDLYTTLPARADGVNRSAPPDGDLASRHPRS